MDLLSQAHLAAVAITITGSGTAVPEVWNRDRIPQQGLLAMLHTLLLADRQL